MGAWLVIGIGLSVSGRCRDEIVARRASRQKFVGAYQAAAFWLRQQTVEKAQPGALLFYPGQSTVRRSEIRCVLIPSVSSIPGEVPDGRSIGSQAIYIRNVHSLRLFRSKRTEVRVGVNESKETEGPFGSRLPGADLYLRDHRSEQTDPKLRSEAKRPRRAASEGPGNRRSRAARDLGRLQSSHSR